MTGMGCSEATLVRSSKKRGSDLRVNLIIPSQGTYAGGTNVSIQGIGFFEGCTATLGGVPCINPVIASSTTLTCKTSAHAVGAVEVVVSCPGGYSTTTANVYAYVDFVNPVPGFAITSGGGITAVTGSTLHHSSIGQVHGEFKQTAADVLHFTGLHGILYDF
jgi:hypothetical protein